MILNSESGLYSSSIFRKSDADLTPVSARTVRDRLVEVDAFPIRASNERLIGVMVTDRATIDEAQRQLKEQEERYRSLFEWSPTPMREEDFSAVGIWLDRLRAEGNAMAHGQQLAV